MPWSSVDHLYTLLHLPGHSVPQGGRRQLNWTLLEWPRWQLQASVGAPEWHMHQIQCKANRTSSSRSNGYQLHAQLDPAAAPLAMKGAVPQKNMVPGTPALSPKPAKHSRKKKVCLSYLRITRNSTPHGPRLQEAHLRPMPPDSSSARPSSARPSTATAA